MHLIKCRWIFGFLWSRWVDVISLIIKSSKLPVSGRDLEGRGGAVCMHWVRWSSGMRGLEWTLTCTGWSLVLMLPTPSTVVTAAPCREHRGTRHAVTEKCLCMRNTKKTGWSGGTALWRTRNCEGWETLPSLWQMTGDCRVLTDLGGHRGGSPLFTLCHLWELGVLSVSSDVLNLGKSLHS